MINFLIISLSILIVIASISKSIMDTVNFKFKDSIFSKIKSEKLKNWFNQTDSWKNKYKDRDPSKGPAFIGSTTIFVWITDAWHFFQMIMLTSYELMCILPIWYVFDFNFLMIFIMLGIVKSVRGFIFEIFWNKILKK